MTGDELNLTGDLEIPGLQDSIEQADLPSLAVGAYLAVVLEAAYKINDNRGIIGFNWKLGVNMDTRRDKTWDLADASWVDVPSLENVFNYTFLGDFNDGKITYRKSGPGFSAINALKAVGEVGNKFSPSEYVGAIVRVQVAHEPHHQEPTRLVAEVQGMYPHFDAEGVPHRITGETDSFE